MKYEFSLHKLAEMVRGMEEEGARFYDVLSNSVESDMLKDIFANLSKAATGHREKFSEIAVTSPRGNKAQYSIDIETLIQIHLNNIQELIFEVKSMAETIEDALIVAINLEETAIWIYRTLHESFSGRLQEVLLEIINEENKHLDILMEIKNKQRIKTGEE